MDINFSSARLRNSVEWQEAIRPYFKARHAEVSSRLARAAAKGDLNALQLESGRLLEIEGILGLEDLLREVEEAKREEEEQEQHGRRKPVFSFWGNRRERERQRLAGE